MDMKTIGRVCNLKLRLRPQIERITRTLERALHESKAAEDMNDSFNEDLNRCEMAIQQALDDLGAVDNKACTEWRKIEREERYGQS